jgi:signal transduction histidine kinase
MILVIVDDITEIQNKNIELDKLNKLKNEFLGIVSHDLRNPISTVQMYANYLLEGITDNTISSKDELKEFLYPILESSEFMLQMLNDLLDISKIESGNFELELTKLNYIELVKNVINKNQKIADNKNINITFEHENNIPEFKIDKHKIENVINNLISNAIKYSEHNSQIIIKISKSDSQVLTEIIDFGQGIPKEQQHNLFLPFKRAGSKTTGGEKSTGLGLSIVKKIVDAHNGEVGVISEKDKGSNFYFKLPII